MARRRPPALPAAPWRDCGDLIIDAEGRGVCQLHHARHDVRANPTIAPAILAVPALLAVVEQCLADHRAGRAVLPETTVTRLAETLAAARP